MQVSINGCKFSKLSLGNFMNNQVFSVHQLFETLKTADVNHITNKASHSKSWSHYVMAN